MMKYPALNEYNGAVQNPRLAFSDSTLKAGKVETTGLGLPRALGGGFAITYTLDAGGRKYAVRCFHKPVPELEQKYRSVSTSLSSDHSGYFVGFEYQPGGVLVNGARYPIVKMDWVEGKTFGAWLEANSSKHSDLENVRRQFADMEAYLRSKSFAHGDIQNGNVIIAKSSRLIDYDGIYVPGLSIGQGTELGHKHFQHPKRSMADFGPTMDRFSFILVDLSFSALMERSSLFQKYSNGENIIFTASDFRDPSQSALFQELWTSPSLKQHALHFARICKSPVKDVPTLVDFLAGRNIPASVIILSSPKTTVPPGSNIYIGAFDVVDALDYAEVQRRVGDRIELVGKIEDVRVDRTRHGKPYIFLNFGNWRLDQVKITIWSEGLAKLSQQPDKSWKGNWISVTGLVDPPYKNRRHKYTHTGITITEPNQLRIVDEQEARRRLASTKSNSNKGTHSGSTNAKILNGLKTTGLSSPSTGATTTNQKILHTLGHSSPQTTQTQTTPTYRPASTSGSKQKSNFKWGIAAVIGFFILLKVLGNTGNVTTNQTVRQNYAPAPVQAPLIQPFPNPPQSSQAPLNILPTRRVIPNSEGSVTPKPQETSPPLPPPQELHPLPGSGLDRFATVPTTPNIGERLQPLPLPLEIGPPPGSGSRGFAAVPSTPNNDENLSGPTDDIRHPSFVGGWAAAASDCNAEGTGVPLIITPRNAETSGGSCQFNSVQRDGAAWKIKAKCAVAGKSWIANIRLTSNGNHLTWSSERGTEVYVRCAAN